jgi:hypothetical protein
MEMGDLGCIPPMLSRGHRMIETPLHVCGLRVGSRVRSIREFPNGMSVGKRHVKREDDPARDRRF